MRSTLIVHPRRGRLVLHPSATGVDSERPHSRGARPWYCRDRPTPASSSNSGGPTNRARPGLGGSGSSSGTTSGAASSSGSSEGSDGSTGSTSSGSSGSSSGAGSSGGADAAGSNLDAGSTAESGPPPTGPCDLYGADGTPCVAAFSTVRAMYGMYSGSLYQVRRADNNMTQGIGPLSPGGVADGAAQGLPSAPGQLARSRSSSISPARETTLRRRLAGALPTDPMRIWKPWPTPSPS